MASEWLVLLWILSAPAAAIVAAVIAGPTAAERIKWGGLCLLVPPFLFWLVFRRATGRGEPSRPQRARPEPMPKVGLEDLDYLPEPVTACPDCGFLGIRAPSVQDGVFPGGGELIFQVCPRCDYRGMPVEFARREDYQSFLDDLAADRRAA